MFWIIVQLIPSVLYDETTKVYLMRSWKKKLKQDEIAVQYEHKMDLAIIHWKDKRDVFMITTCIPDSKAIVRRRGVEKTLPDVIHTYNNMIDGVGQSDQMTTSYPTECKWVKKWYKKHFMHLINISSFNAHIIHKKEANWTHWISAQNWLKKLSRNTEPK